MIEVRPTSGGEARQLIFSAKCDMTDREKQLIDRCLLTTAHLWVGLYDGELVNAWGLIPPTMLSEQAYLWMLHTENLNGHEFVFVRHSQRAVEEMLKLYPTIVGYVDTRNVKGRKWIEWLGGEFGVAEGHRVPFVIRSKWHG